MNPCYLVIRAILRVISISIPEYEIRINFKEVLKGISRKIYDKSLQESQKTISVEISGEIFRMNPWKKRITDGNSLGIHGKF